MTYQPTEIETKLYAWVNRVIGSSATVVYANQGEHRPTLPFATIEILTNQLIESIPLEVMKDEEFNGGYRLETLMRYEGTLSVQVYGVNAHELARVLQRSILLSSTISFNASLDLSVFSVLSNNNIPQFSNTETIQRRSVDFAFYHNETVVEAVGTIETVLVNDDFGKPSLEDLATRVADAIPDTIAFYNTDTNLSGEDLLYNLDDLRIELSLPDSSTVEGPTKILDNAWRVSGSYIKTNYLVNSFGGQWSASVWIRSSVLQNSGAIISSTEFNFQPRFTLYFFGPATLTYQRPSNRA
jgi:hypothetical protein